MFCWTSKHLHHPTLFPPKVPNFFGFILTLSQSLNAYLFIPPQNKSKAGIKLVNPKSMYRIDRVAAPNLRPPRVRLWLFARLTPLVSVEWLAQAAPIRWSCKNTGLPSHRQKAEQTHGVRRSLNAPEVQHILQGQQPLS